MTNPSLEKLPQTTVRVPHLSYQNFTHGTTNEKLRFVDQLFSGTKSFGFVVLKDHFISQDLLDQAYQVVRQLFALPLQEKMNMIDPHGGSQRGYTPFGKEHAKDNPNPDLKEFWHIGREVAQHHPLRPYFPPNIWPAQVPQFRPVLERMYNDLEQMAHGLLEALGTGLDLAPGTLPQLATGGNSILRAIHYPPLDLSKVQNGLRAAPHGDINLITLLVGATSSGLQLLDHQGQWMDIHHGASDIVMDTGDMMSRITNDVLPTTVHRVINTDLSSNSQRSQARYSLPFFCHPHPQATLSCLPTCIGSGAKYPDISSHQFLTQRLKEIGLGAPKQSTCEE